MLSQPSCPPAARGPQPTRRMAVAALLLGTAATAAWQWQSGWGQQGAETTTPPTVGDDVCVVAPPRRMTRLPASPWRQRAMCPQTPAARCAACTRSLPRLGGAGHLCRRGRVLFRLPLSLMMYLGNVGHYTRGRTASAIVARYVTDMDSGAWVDAQQAVYVAGSSALGPMRAGNLPAFADRGAAQRFVQARGGGFWVLTPSTRPCSPAWHHSAAVATGNTRTDDRNFERFAIFSIAASAYPASAGARFNQKTPLNRALLHHDWLVGSVAGTALNSAATLRLGLMLAEMPLRAGTLWRQPQAGAASETLGS